MGSPVQRGRGGCFVPARLHIARSMTTGSPVGRVGRSVIALRLGRVMIVTTTDWGVTNPACNHVNVCTLTQQHLWRSARVIIVALVSGAPAESVGFRVTGGDEVPNIALGCFAKRNSVLAFDNPALSSESWRAQPRSSTPGAPSTVCA